FFAGTSVSTFTSPFRARKDSPLQPVLLRLSNRPGGAVVSATSFPVPSSSTNRTPVRSGTSVGALEKATLPVNLSLPFRSIRTGFVTATPQVQGSQAVPTLSPSTSA